MSSMSIRFVGWLTTALSITSMLLAAVPVFAATDDNAQQPHLLLISIDGFRHDYQARYSTPALDRISARGIRAESVRPVWPSLTFPNNYSIVTGLYPAEHGIVANEFPDDLRETWYRYKDSTTVQDGRWYAGEPLWVAAERAGMISATYFFVGSEARISDVSPSHWRAFDGSVPGDERVAQVLDWLTLPAAERPQMIGLYFEQVDVASHRYGPGSAESIAAIEQVDRWIGKLLDGIEQAGLADQLHVAVVSDHGQSQFRQDPEPLVLSEFLELDGVTVRASGAFAMLYLDEPDPARARELRDAINARWQHGRAWLPAEAPADWHVGDNPRLGDVLLQADLGYAVINKRRPGRKSNQGDHGWSPNDRDMHGIFVAAGPRLPAGKMLGTIGITDAYPLFLELLGLPDRRDAPPASPLCAVLQATAACRQNGTR